MPRTSWAWICTHVMPWLQVTSVRSRSACPASKGLQQPPILAGRVLPLTPTRRISRCAAIGLAAERAAA